MKNIFMEKELKMQLRTFILESSEKNVVGIDRVTMV